MTTVRTQTLDRERSIGLVSVAGWLADEDVERFRRTLMAAAEAHAGLVVDLADAVDISAAAIGALAEAAATVRWRGGPWAVVAAGDVAGRIDEAGMSEALAVFPDMQQARKAVLGTE